MSNPASTPEDSALIMPTDVVLDRGSLAQFGEAEVVWLRNPTTGVIHKFHNADARHGPRDSDTIARCLKEGYTLSSEAAARTQAVELARLQGRPLPEWANDPHAEKPSAKAAR